MRRTRPLILLLITAIVAVVAIKYSAQRATQALNAPSLPTALPKDTSVHANEVTFDKTKDSRTVYRVFAKDWRQNSEGTRLELEGVRLHLYHKDGKAYDEVKSAKAEYDRSSETLFSDGEVEITTGLSGDAKTPSGRLVKIKTSGVLFESKLGTASTLRPSYFQFDRGEGSCIGARYDPATRELQMYKDVKLTWWGEKPEQNRMQVESGALLYKEAESKAILTPWTKFQRGTLTVEGENSIVTLQDGVLRQVEAVKARGADAQPKRQLQFGADQLLMQFNASGTLEKITGTDRARLNSLASTAHTEVRTQRIDLEFEAGESDSLLKKAVAKGESVVSSKPAAKTSTMSETRVIKSDTIALYMHPNGEDLDRVETETPGTVDFLPNRPGQRKRTVTGDRLKAQYGAGNQLRSFFATKASTRTEAEPVRGKPQRPPALTWSDHLSAEFNESTGAMDKLEQRENFRYEEGERRARAQTAVMIPGTEMVTLTGSARFWDTGGSTAADTILMNQKSSDVEALGNVNSTRMPEKSKKRDGLLSGDQPVHARAARMITTGENNLIRYEGDALMWQAANRIQADRISIDRKAGHLEADGKVVSQLLDKSKVTQPATSAGGATAAAPAANLAKNQKSAPTAPIFTTVNAPHMTYSEKERVAHYTGGATLRRSTTVVTAAEIRAYLKPAEQDSSLEKAVADGNVKIVQTAPDRTKTGVSEHAEYYPDDGRVLLEGGEPKLNDSVKGETRGTRLTYFSMNDRLLVEGGQQQPVRSRLLRK